jgi:hypothetical protein
MRIAILMFVFFLASCAQAPKLVIPEPQRDEIFTRFVNPITDKYGLPKLRETRLSGDDLEIRVWLSSYEIDGFILKRINDDWSAIAIKEIDCNTIGYYPKDKIYELGKINLSPPKSGWENTWRKLVETEIIDLPYSYYISTIDETSYRLETNVNGIYRIRFYGSKDSSQEAERMRKIGEIIADEFGLHNFKIGSLCLEK